MRTILIVLKLGYTEELYTSLINYLKTGVYWARPFSGVWIVKTTKTTNEIRDGITSLINGTDQVLVVDITGSSAAWKNIDSVISEWMKNNI